MRMLIATVIAVLGWTCLPSAFEAPVPDLAEPQDSPAAKAPQVEQIMIPIGGGLPSNVTKPYWGTIGGDGEVFREIRALAKEGIVAGPGQAPPKLRILREFFAPVPTPYPSSGLLGHYVFIVECIRSDLKHVVSPGLK